MKRQLILEDLAGYDPEIGRWLWAMEDARRRTKETLQGLDDRALDWVASHAENSIGALLYHIAAIETDWLYADVLEGAEFPPDLVALFPHDVRDDQGKLVAAAGETLADQIHRLDTVRRYFLDVFRGMTLAEFRRVRHLPDYDVTPEWVIHHLMQHEAEHRGQIGELRLLVEQSLTRSFTTVHF
jgi:uncharacterized damage-inducible protein DinB